MGVTVEGIARANVGSDQTEIDRLTKRAWMMYEVRCHILYSLARGGQPGKRRLDIHERNIVLGRNIIDSLVIGLRIYRVLDRLPGYSWKNSTTTTSTPLATNFATMSVQASRE